MKKLLALALFVLLFVLHAACGGGGYSSPTAPAGPTPMPGSAPTPTPPRY